jgi:hypothetical protein
LIARLVYVASSGPSPHAGQAIAELEAQLTSAIERFEDHVAIWHEALSANQNARAKEIAYLKESIFLHPIRHIDRGTSAQIELLKSRLAFLRLLKSEIDNA